jgi:dTDP-4-dehydrorhamnose reductase
LSPLRLIVAGATGQMARALLERGAAQGVAVHAVGRPALDLADPAGVERALGALEGDAIVNAAAYTAVDRAETEEDLARRINAEGAGAVARAAARRGLPLLHLSTDYVFDGALQRPYREDDWPRPLGAYGRSKREGELAVAQAHPGAVILRTSWVYAPFGANFLRTMLRLGERQESVAVVADQRGAPTYALDLADALIAIARRRRARPHAPELAGLFHATGGGAASWADFAEAIFAEAARLGRAPVAVRRITTADHPTPAARPANSLLSNEKLAAVYGLALPDWRASTRACVSQALERAA